MATHVTLVTTQIDFDNREKDFPKQKILTQSLEQIYMVDDWELRWVDRNIFIPLFFIRGKLMTTNGEVLVDAWYSNRIETIDDTGRIETNNGPKLVLGKPNQEFVDRLKEYYMIKEGMTRIDFLAFNMLQHRKLFRYHPYMLGQMTTQSDPTDIFIETNKLLEEVGVRPLAKEDKEFLAELMSGQQIGDWLCNNGVLYYRGKVAFQSKL